MNLVYIVILNWNGWRDTQECLESLTKLEGVDYRVVVCDNASSDGSISHLQDWAARHYPGATQRLSRQEIEAGAALPAEVRLALVDNGGNLGFAGGNNSGVRLAMNDPACRFVWLLNNDTTVEPDSLVHAVRHANADPAIGLCGSTLVYYHNRGQMQALGGARYSRVTGRSAHVGAFRSSSDLPNDATRIEKQLSYVVGAAMLASRAFIEQVGYMREDYFLYYEEIDWATRGKAFRLGYAPRSRVYHKEGASIGTAASGGSALSCYYLYRNRLRFTWRYHRGYVPTVLAAMALDMAKLLYRRRWPQLGAALRGTLQLAY